MAADDENHLSMRLVLPWYGDGPTCRARRSNSCSMRPRPATKAFGARSRPSCMRSIPKPPIR